MQYFFLATNLQSSTHTSMDIGKVSHKENIGKYNLIYYLNI